MNDLSTDNPVNHESAIELIERCRPVLRASWKIWKDILIPLLAVFGSIGAFFSLTDRFWPPTVDVLGVLPVYVRGTEKITIWGKPTNFPKRGVSFILMLQSKDREVSITELEISGRLHLTMNEWIAHNDEDGVSLKELSDQMSTLRPYHDVQWIGWPEGGNQSLRMRPGETYYARFTFLEPVSYTRGYSTHPDYLGIESSGARPKLVRHYLEPHEFFRRKLSGNEWLLELPAEFASGELRLILRAGRKKVHIDPHQIQPLKTIKEDQWRQKPVVDLYHNRDLKFPSSSEGW